MDTQRLNKQLPSVLCLTSTFPRWENDTEPNFVQKLVELLSSRFTFDVVAPHYPGAARIEKTSKYNLFRYRYLATSNRTLCYKGGILANIKSRPITRLLVLPFFVSQTWTIVRLSRRNDYSLVHCHWWFPQGFCYLISLLFVRKRPLLLLTLHGGDLYFSRSLILRRLMRMVLTRADHVSVVSHQMKKDCISFGIDASAITVAPMGIDIRAFRAYTLPDFRKGIIFVGRIVEKKGLNILLQAMPQVLDRHPGTCLTVIGDGPDLAKSEQMAQNLGISPYVRFRGAMSHQQIPHHLNQHQIAVIPSIVAKSGDAEGLGLTVVEAAACGCVVVASDIGAIRDIIDPGRTGILVPSGSCQALANALISLLSNREAAATLAHSAATVIPNRFSWNVCSDKYSKMYSRLLERSASEFDRQSGSSRS